MDTFLTFEETEQSKIFDNAAFGYWKVTVERPLRLRGIDPTRVYTAKEIKELKAAGQVDANAPPVISATHKPGKATPDPLHGKFTLTPGPSPKERGEVVEYESDPDLRDTEQIPLLEDGGIEGFFAREVLPCVPDAWIDEGKTRIGYEISFNRYFYKPEPLRTLADIRADIEALERETDGLLEQILVEVCRS